MNQPELLSIDPPTIREIVQDRLSGFKYRQQAREAKRKRENEQQRARLILRRGRKRAAKQETFPEDSQMQEIKVSYRAIFQQLKRNWKSSAPCEVELIRKPNGMWLAIEPNTKAPWKFQEMPSIKAAKEEAGRNFEAMLSDEWWIVGKPPGSKADTPRAALDPALLCEKDGKVYWLEANDFTHVFDPQKRPDSSVDVDKAWPAACGQTPRLRRFVSLKAGVPPTCAKCLEIYQRDVPAEVLG